MHHEKASTATMAVEALQYTQAALNAAHALALVTNAKKQKPSK